MELEYKLNKKAAKKYGFTHLIASGWFGYYNDTFNKKFNDNKKEYIKIELTEEDINYIVKNKIGYKEY